MKVLMTSIYYPPRLGGIENHVYYLCHGLADEGCEVSVVTSRTEPESAPHEIERGGVSVDRVYMPERSRFGWVVNAVASIPAAIRKGVDADVIHAHTFQAILPALPLLVRKKPLVVTIHSSHFLRMVEKPHWRAVFRALLSPASLILAPSEELAEACRRVASNERVVTYTNAIDTNLFRPVAPSIKRRGDRAILVAARRLVEKNGVHHLIEGLPAILRRIPVDLYLAGIGPEQADLERRIAHHSLEDHVHFLGAVPNHELPPILSSADAVVVPSLLEATSLAALEAMACERPMAVSRVGGLPEIIDESCGVLFESANPDDLADKIVDLLSRPVAEREKMGREGRRRVLASWSIPALVAKHLGHYRDAIGDAGT